MAPEYVISGSVAPGYEPVKEMFEKNFENGTEEHSQLCAYVKGEKVVDLWGTVDKTSGFDADSLTNVFSSTKSLTAIMMAMAKDRGLLDYADKISKHWPEFGQEGKEDLTIADLMRHECGLPSLTPPPSVEDIQTANIKTNALGELIEKHKLSWPVEGKRQYHSVTRGWIANEIFRRADPQKRTMGEFLDLEIAKKLGADVFIGCSKQNYFPVKEIPMSTRAIQAIKKSFGLSSWSDMTFGEMFSLIRNMTRINRDPAIEGMTSFMLFNEPDVRKSESSSVNGNCSARGLARVAAAMANKGEFEGVRLMSEDAWFSMHDKPTSGFLIPPLPLRVPITQGGVAAFDDERTGWNGWMGYGGSVFQWHPRLKIGFGYTCTYLYGLSIRNTKAMKLQLQVADCASKL